MINRIPTSDFASSNAAPSAPSPARYRRAPGVLFLSLFLLLALWANAAKAASVVTFTNFPSAVSNTYNGIITLQINGLTNGVTNVIVQKFLDLNTNGIIDSGDLLVQQFPLAVGQAPMFTNGSTIVTVTNFMPGDLTLGTTGQITAPLNFQDGDFLQNFAGQYLYKISSPLGQFSPVTNLFTVTNLLFTSMVTGEVQNAGGGAVSNALVLLFSTQNGGGYVQAAAVANNSGFYSIRAQPGPYYLVPAKSNFVANLASFQQSPFSLNAGSTNGANLLLNTATTNITGPIYSTTSSASGLPGISGLAISTNGFLSLYVSDTNGNFIAPVITNEWIVPVNSFSAAFAGYLTWQTNQLYNVSNTLVRATNVLASETAIFYGVVSNANAVPLPGVYLFAFDNAGHQSQALTDKNGNYVLGAQGGTNEWQLAILSPDNPGLTNISVFSPGYVQTNINPGQAIQQNFNLKLAPYIISGTVQSFTGTPVGGVQVFATSSNFQAFVATTAANGTYSLNVAPGTWTVGLNTNSLASLGFTNFPATQTTVISDNNEVINFSILVCGEVAILTTNLPNAIVGSPYNTQLLATSCQNIANWSTAFGVTLTGLADQTNVVYPAGTAIYSGAQLVGYTESSFNFGLTSAGGTFFTNITGSVSEPGGNTVNFLNLSAPMNVSAPITNTISIQFTSHGGDNWRIGPTIQNGSTYSTTVTLAEKSLFYKLNQYQPYPVTAGTLLLNTSAIIPSNTVGVLAGNFTSLATGSSANTASVMAFTNLAGSVVWLQSGANLGNYLISGFGPQTGGLPPGITLFPNGMLAGTPTSTGTNNGTFNFTVDAVDASGNVAVQSLTLFVFTNTLPTMSTPLPLPATNNTVLSANLFNLQVNGVLAGENYTVLMSTNLASTNWMPIFTTNVPNTNSFIFPDVNATNRERFYRIQMGP